MASISIIGDRVFIDGREVTGTTTGTEPNPADDKPATKTHVAKAIELALDITTAAVTVTSSNEPGIRVEVEGPVKFVDSVTFQENGGVLSVKEAAEGSFSSFAISNSTIVVGNNTIVVGGSSNTKRQGKIRVIIPDDTPVTVDGTGTSRTEISASVGPVRLGLSDQADFRTSSCQRHLRAKLSGQTKAIIDDGVLKTLDVVISGQADFYYGGQAEEVDAQASGQSGVKLLGIIEHAHLVASGMSDITARGATGRVTKRASGMATIRA